MGGLLENSSSNEKAAFRRLAVGEKVTGSLESTVLQRTRLWVRIGLVFRPEKED